MVDLSDYFSHPKKFLQKHIDGVVEGVQYCTSLKIAEISAIFHDLGKINPNFQKKLNPEFLKKLDSELHSDYSNHAYLSAFSFLCFCAANQKYIMDLFNGEKQWIASITAIIAHHHGNLPDFLPCILKIEESERLIGFLNRNPFLPISDYLKNNLSHNEFSLIEQPNKEFLCKEFPIRLVKHINNPLDYFLDTQYAFACLIASDKKDASGYSDKEKSITHFCNQYHKKLDNFISTLKQDNDLNKLRTQIRLEAQANIQDELKNNKRIFSLTAPTGSGKTIMLLTLAGEILNVTTNLRIIYALPFLSITEQVDKICKEIFCDLENYVRRIDSKSENLSFEIIQKALDDKPEELKNILHEQMAEDTFDYPFIITTFVRLFETLLSNKNSTLLKLPNFSKCIFLVDEIQALPPRLYGFFLTLLDAFCQKFDSYAIISTATMPNFELPKNNKHNLKNFFNKYVIPPELLSLENFKHDLFDRYSIQRIPEAIQIDKLAGLIINEKSSVLVILNTIQDTSDLFNALDDMNSEHKIVLLNTHFTPNDRQEKIFNANKFLKNKIKIILISTQLIEAGVDIDFPVVYRDMSPVPNIIQSAGRCNRNGKRIQKGKLVLFDLQNHNISRSSLIYRGKDSGFLNYAKNTLYGKTFHEVDLIEIQKGFFNDIQLNTIFGYHEGNKFNNGEIDFIEAIEKASFAEIGKFRLIDEIIFGEEYRYYIPTSNKDHNYEYLQQFIEEIKEIDVDNYEMRKVKKIQIENQLKKMAGQIVQVRLRMNDIKPVPCYDECCGIFKLSINSYSPDEGIILSNENQFL